MPRKKIKSDEIVTETQKSVEEIKKGANESNERFEYKTYLPVYEKVIDSIEFNLLSPEQILKMSAVKIITHELYDSEGYPVDGGLVDTRMGVVDPGLRCRTCGGTVKTCPGHPGHIELARPVYHPKFVSLIYVLLRTTCPVCGMPLLGKDELNLVISKMQKAKENMTPVEFREFSKKIRAQLKWRDTCQFCNAKQANIIFEKPYTFYEEDRRLTPLEVRSRLEKIRDDVLILYGIDPMHARPEWMVLTVLLVPSVLTRPSLTLETGERSEDDLTHKLSDIVRFNQRLFENINAGVPEAVIEDMWDLLQYHVATYFDNTIPQLPPARNRSGQTLKSLVERLKGKEGRMRQNLVGKRVNFSARSVISPDPKINFDEVGVPEVIAKELTLPMRVTTWNIEYAKKFIENAEKYPGANYVIRPDGTIKKVTEETKEMLLEEIKPGYIVERHLMDGDIVLFNRYPSLHRMSLMAHKVKIVSGKTFRLNPAVCLPYNADFDGDEMNLHVLQTIEAQAEARELLYIPYNVIVPKNGLAVVGPSLDSIAGNYMLSKLLKLPRNEIIDLLAKVGVTDFSRLKEGDILEGKEAYACIFPEDFYFEGPTKEYDSKKGKNQEGWLIIKNGRIVQGFLDGKVLASGSGLLIRKLYSDYGEEKTLKILQKLSLLGISTVTRFGLTAAISHFDLDETVIQKIKDVLKSAEKNSDSLINQYYSKTLEPLPGRTLEETLEIKILSVLNNARNEIGKIILEATSKLNESLLMIKSGAKGNIINVSQIAGIVGQQSLGGQRINIGYSGRVLPHFKKNDLTPKAKGFIETSFKKGMKPAEFFFQAVTGRDSLISKGMSTPKSGYLYRRMANSMQDLIIDYNLAVRDSTGTIIQYAFGDDGIDVSKSEVGTINVKRIIEEELYN
ncbi:MAG: DNA-directed RNA polymerase subunit A' [Candidatus Woesearchaeota archaeon]